MRAGHTRVTPAALRHTVETIAARAFGVPGSNVTAVLEDDSGRLGATVSVQLALPSLLGPREDSAGGTVFERSRAAREDIITRGLDLTGRTLGRVNIRLTGAKPSPGPAKADARAGQVNRNRPNRNPANTNQPSTNPAERSVT